MRYDPDMPRSLNDAPYDDVPFESGSSADLNIPSATQARLPGPIHYTRTPTVEVPEAVLERHRVAAVAPGPSADAFRVLRTQLLMMMRKNGWRTLAITSPNRGAGKSTVSMNLAISFAAELDVTALLVDADLREPYIRQMLELPPGPGLADYLVGRVNLANLLIHPNLGNLTVLPGGIPVAHTSELMRSPMMAKLVRELRSRYTDRIVLFDVPPILAGADTLGLSAYMDATILLVEECRSSRDDIERSCNLLRHSNLIGIILNKSRELPEPEPEFRRAEPTMWQRILGRR